MNTPQTFDELTRNFKAYLRHVCRKDHTIFRYAQLWARIKIFMDTHNMRFYDKQVGEAYLDHLFGDTGLFDVNKVLSGNLE